MRKSGRCAWAGCRRIRNSMQLAGNRHPGRAGRGEVDAEIRQWVVDQLKSGELNFAVQDPDAPENWPRLWFIWRGNALNASAKGQEYFFKHYLGTHHQIISEEVDGKTFSEADLARESPRGQA